MQETDGVIKNKKMQCIKGLKAWIKINSYLYEHLAEEIEERKKEC